MSSIFILVKYYFKSYDDWQEGKFTKQTQKTLRRKIKQQEMMALIELKGGRKIFGRDNILKTYFLNNLNTSLGELQNIMIWIESLLVM